VRPFHPLIFRRTLHYLANLSLGRFVLWCYFIWWLVVLVRYFDPSPLLGLTSLGLSLIIGFALFVNTTASGASRMRLEPWPTFRRSSRRSASPASRRW